MMQVALKVRSTLSAEVIRRLSLPVYDNLMRRCIAVVVFGWVFDLLDERREEAAKPAWVRFPPSHRAPTGARAQPVTAGVRFAQSKRSCLVMGKSERKRLYEELSSYAAIINDNAQDCAYRDELIERLHMLVRLLRVHVPANLAEEADRLLLVPVTRPDGRHDPIVLREGDLGAAVHAARRAAFDATLTTRDKN